MIFLPLIFIDLGSKMEALWSRTNKNPDVNNGPLAQLFARSLTPFTHSLALHCLLCTACFAGMFRFTHSFAYSLTHSQACGKVNY